MAIARDRHNEGSLNGTTAIQLVPPAPAGMKLVITSLQLHNEDDQARTFTVKLRTGRHVRSITQAAPTLYSFVWSIPTHGDLEVPENGELTAQTDSSANSTEPTYEVYWRMERI